MRSLLSSYTEEQYDRRETVCGILALAGFVWGGACVFGGMRVFVLTAIAAVFTGAMFGCYRSRKTERGVWMLALLAGVLITGFYVLCLVMEIRDLVTGRTQPTGWLAADVLATTVLVEIAARASWTVFRQNRELQKSPER